ncbi:MAG: hypothetical protein QGG40_00170, partial [Myxococcota bacterium]|nr:hypothetical protein [Myxococcota bacterium]
FCLTYLTLIAPWAWWFASHWEVIPGTSEVFQFPHPQSLEGSAKPAVPFLVAPGKEMGQALAASTWLLGVAGIVLAMVRRGDATLRGLAIVAVGFTLLSWGPRFPGAPYTLLYGIADPLRRFWWPVRHVVIAHAALGALGALVLTHTARRWKQKWPRTAHLDPLLGILAFASVPLLLHLQKAPAQVALTHLRLPPPAYTDLADMDGEILLEPPLSPKLAGTQQHLIYQLFHRKTLLSGHATWVDRVRPDAWDSFVSENSFLSALQAMEQGGSGTTLRFDAADLQTLLDQGVRWFGVNREYFALSVKDRVGAYADVFEGLFGRPVLQARGLKIWDGSRWDGKDQVEVRALTWPPGVEPGGPDQPLVGLRPKSLVFDSQARRVQKLGGDPKEAGIRPEKETHRGPPGPRRGGPGPRTRESRANDQPAPAEPPTDASSSEEEPEPQP